MFKIQLENNEFYKSKSGRIQHYRSMERADAKIKKLGDIGTGATVIESKARTARTLNPEENATETKTVKVSKAKKASTKPDKSVTDEKISKGKKAKKNKNT